MDDILGVVMGVVSGIKKLINREPAAQGSDNSIESAIVSHKTIIFYGNFNKKSFYLIAPIKSFQLFFFICTWQYFEAKKKY